MKTNQGAWLYMLRRSHTPHPPPSQINRTSMNPDSASHHERCVCACLPVRRQLLEAPKVHRQVVVVDPQPAAQVMRQVAIGVSMPDRGGPRTSDLCRDQIVLRMPCMRSIRVELSAICECLPTIPCLPLPCRNTFFQSKCTEKIRPARPCSRNPLHRRRRHHSLLYIIHVIMVEAQLLGQLHSKLNPGSDV